MSSETFLTPARPIAVTVLSGFLGSGKTTVLNALLRAPHGLRMAVIVNEFGSVGVDGALVTGGDKFVQLENGCLCCVLNDDLERTLADLAAMPHLDHILIETTGIADPLPVTWACGKQKLEERLRVDAVVTVVDAAHVGQALCEADEVAMQLRRADVLLINKLDLVDDDGRAAVALARLHNDHAPELLWRGPTFPVEALLGISSPRPQNEPEAAIAGHHSHVGHYSHLYATDAIVDEREAEDLALTIPASVFRFKALLRVDCAEGSHLLLNGVAGRLDLRFISPASPPRTSTWQFFGARLDRAALQTLCDRLGPRLSTNDG